MSRRPTIRSFSAAALTYYGRWTYKYEEATRHGAVAAIHDSHDADGQLWMGRGSVLLGA